MNEYSQKGIKKSEPRHPYRVSSPEELRELFEKQDRAREEIRQRIGIVNFAVPCIRALRDGGEEDFGLTETDTTTPDSRSQERK